MNTAVIGTDDLHTYETFSAEAESVGFEAVWAADGLDLLEEVGRRCPAVVFVDVSIPVINAYDCCAELRRDRTLPKELPVVLLADNETNPLLIMRSGFSGTFPKNHDFFDLRELLAQTVWK